MGFDAQAAARFITEAHEARAAFRNLPDGIGPTTLDEAYAAQEALHPILSARWGAAAGVKIATTTRVMQELMGIDRPSFGVIFAGRVHSSRARLDLAPFISLKIECELAVRLGRDLVDSTVPYTGETVAPAIEALMPAFELVDDRAANYRETRALSLIADNCWNAGVVLGRGRPYAPGLRLTGLAGTLTINGQDRRQGRTENPLEAVAWVANMAAERGRPLRKGQFVMTGSIIPTLPVGPGDRFSLAIESLGEVLLRVD